MGEQKCYKTQVILMDRLERPDDKICWIQVEEGHYHTDRQWSYEMK